jgi:AcrR family transcriptional regulator
MIGAGRSPRDEQNTTTALSPEGDMSIIEQDDRLVSASAPRMTARERRRLETQERIRTVAFELFQNRGFEATTVDEIAEAAGVSRRTFFNHFPNKDDVVSQRFESLERLVGDAARRIAPTSGCPYEIASRAVSEMMEHSGITRDELLGALRLMLDNPTLAARVFERQLRWEKAVIDAINDVAPGRFDADEMTAGVASAFAVLRSASLSWAASGAGGFRTRVRAMLERFVPRACGSAS